jgi:membrane protease YdiL (CAAX protease family)
MSAITNFAKRRPLLAFLCLAFTISWLLFLVPLFSTRGFGVLPYDVPLEPFVLLSAIVGLALSAALVTRAAAGKSGVKALFQGIIHWRVNPLWYLVALFTVPFVSILVATLWRGGEPLQALASKWPLFFTSFLPNALLIALLVSLWEETGWTGFLLPPLQKQVGPLLGSLIVNFFQSLLHLPLLFISGGLSESPITPSQYPEYLLYLFVYTIPVRFMMTWLFNGTRGSLLIVALFHGAWNTTAGPDFIPEFVPGDDTVWVYGALAAIVVIVLLLTRGKLADEGELSTPARVNTLPSNLS